jgi:hypothetical protein
MSSAVSDQSLNTSNSLMIASSDATSTSSALIGITSQILTNSANQYKIDLDDEGNNFK